MIPGKEYLDNLLDAKNALVKLTSDPDVPGHLVIYMNRVIVFLDTEIVRHSYTATLEYVNRVTGLTTHDGECDRISQPWPVDPNLEASVKRRRLGVNFYGLGINQLLDNISQEMKDDCVYKSGGFPDPEAETRHMGPDQ